MWPPLKLDALLRRCEAYQAAVQRLVGATVPTLPKELVVLCLDYVGAGFDFECLLWNGGTVRGYRARPRARRYLGRRTVIPGARLWASRTTARPMTWSEQALFAQLAHVTWRLPRAAVAAATAAERSTLLFCVRMRLILAWDAHTADNANADAGADTRTRWRKAVATAEALVVSPAEAPAPRWVDLTLHNPRMCLFDGGCRALSWVAPNRLESDALAG